MEDLLHQQSKKLASSSDKIIMCSSHIHTPKYLYCWQKFLPRIVMGGKFGCDSQSAVLYFVLSEPLYVTKLCRKPPSVTFCSW